MEVFDIHLDAAFVQSALPGDQLASPFDTIGLDEDLVDAVGEGGDGVFLLDGLLTERLIALAAVRPRGVVQRLAPDAFLHLGPVVVDIDVDAVGGRDGTLTLRSEDGNVARGFVRATHPAVVVLEEGLVDVLTSQVACRGLPEARRRRLRRELDGSPIASLIERLPDHVPRDAVGFAELGPEVVLTIARVAFEPVADERDGFDDGRRPTTVLAVLDGDLEAVVAVGDVLDLDLVEFGGPRAEVPAERDERLVANVLAGVDHRLDVFLPVEHQPGIGRRVVVTRVAGGDPVQGLGEFLQPAEGMAAERPEDLSVAAVGLWVVVGPVDPADNLLRGVAVRQSGRESAVVDFPSHLDRAHQDVAVVAVRDTGVADELQVMVRVEDGVGVSVGEAVAVATALNVTPDGRSRLVGHAPSDTSGACKPQVGSPPRPYYLRLTCPNSQTASGGAGNPSSSPVDHQGVSAV